MSNERKKIILDDENAEIDGKVPELELSLSGANHQSFLGKIVNSGLNVLSAATTSITGKRKTAPPQKGFAPTLKGPELPKEKPKATSGYSPTWRDGGVDQNIEYTNFKSAIGEYEHQQANIPRNRVGGGNQPFVIRRHRTGLPFIYKLAIFILFVMFTVGTAKYLDKKYNIRQTIKELKDPSKTKLRQKIKKKDSAN